jgi:NAD+ synthase
MFDDVCIERRIALEKVCKRENLLLIGAGNKSEDLTGWFTVGGVDDMPYSPIKSLYKTQVRQLAEYLEVPVAIRKREPIPDGLSGVSDALALGMNYEKIDMVLYGIEHDLQDEEIMKYGVTKREIEKVCRLKNLSSWKRVA